MAGKIIAPQVTVPPFIQQGDSVSWIDEPFMDVEGTDYDSATYTLTYSIVGPSALTLTAVAKGMGWITSATAVQTTALIAGKYFWQARIAGNSLAITVAHGELQVLIDLATQVAGYDGLSKSEHALASWEAALSALTGANGAPVEMYKVGEREMKFRQVPEILATIAYLRAKVLSEKTANSIAQGQGNPRKLYLRWPGRFGIQT